MQITIEDDNGIVLQANLSENATNADMCRLLWGTSIEKRFFEYYDDNSVQSHRCEKVCVPPFGVLNAKFWDSSFKIRKGSDLQ